MKKLNEHLDGHDVICWDVDKTLINGPNSLLFRNWIKKNTHLEHHVVTFRCVEEDVENLKHELFFPEEDFSIGLFNSIITMPIEHNMDHVYPKEIREMAYLSNDEFLIQTKGLDREEMLRWMDICYNYKAQSCINVNSLVLIDDLYQSLLPFFNKHNLILIDSLQDFS